MIQDLVQATHLSPLSFYLIGFSILLLAAVAIGFTLNRVFRRLAKQVANNWAKLLFALLQSLSVPLFILLAVYTALEILVLPRKYEQIGTKVIFALVVIVTFYFLTRVVILFLGRWGQQEPALKRVTEPAGFLVRLVFALLAVIIIVENLGIHLTAVWTTLGVGSVAVALALQDTLGNFFAGLYLLADRPISPGDYIKMDGQEGFVSHVGWRTTSIRTLGNNMIVIPNSILAKAVITNYSMPDERMSLDIRVSVAYGTDARRVEKILVEIAQQAIHDGLEGLLPGFPPEAKLIPGFGDSSLDFTLGVKIRRFIDQYAVQSELRKRILERFEAERIDMPFPTQTILLDRSVSPPRDAPPAKPAESSPGGTPSNDPGPDGKS